MVDVGSSSESEVEWEDVEPLAAGSGLAHHGEEGEERPGTSASAASLEIVLQGGASLHKGKRKSKQQFLEKMVAAFNKELQCSLHKVHLLCLLAHGLRLSDQCDNQLLQSVLLSLLPVELLHSNTEHYNQDSLLKILKWSSAKMSQLSKHVETTSPDSEFQSLTVVQLLVALLRAIGLRTRLILVLNPISFKPASVKSNKNPFQGSPVAGRGNEPVTTKSGESSGATKKDALSEDVQTSQMSVMAEGGNGKTGKEEEKGVSMSVEGEPPTESRGQKRKAAASSHTKRRTSKRLPSAEGDTSYNQGLQDEDGVKKEDHGSSSQGSRGKRSRGKGKSRLQPTSTSSRYFKKSIAAPLKSQEDVESGVESCSNSDSDFIPETQSSKVKIGGQPDDDDSDDFDDKPKGKKRGRKRSRGRLSRGSKGTSPPPKAKKLKVAADENRNSSSEVSRRESGDDPAHQDPSEARVEPDEPKSGEMYSDRTSWVEVYVQSKRQWKSVHLPSLSVGQPQLCEKHCSQPLHYIIGIENAAVARTVCDVTARYASHWCTHVRKQRLSEAWWAETLDPLSPSREEKEEEEEDFLAILYARPFPTSISEYKGHPLYALRRHLLKFEAIYPEDSKILGSCRGEPIYAREHVCTLHTRETWMKEGRVVKKGEKPYKVVKARPKRGQSVLEAQSSTVETFGWWQTEEYVPPPVVDGKVPRNEYGNVELFQSSMLPPGACHIKIQGVQRVARKLGIDFAPAMMGWDFHSGYCHPILEGIVVAKEYEEVLLEAWEQEEQVLIEKEMKKREQRVLEKWRQLTRGLLIRERVKRRYKLS